MLDEMERYFEEFEKDIEDTVKNSIFGRSEPGKPFVAGFSFNMGPGGKPSVQIFGDSPVRRDGYRSPISEQVLDEKGGQVRLLLEMPGVEKEDIAVDATEDSATVTAEKGERRYKSEISLKAPVRPESGKAEYRNGMLDISFSLKDKDNKGSKRVNVV